MTSANPSVNKKNEKAKQEQHDLAYQKWLDEQRKGHKRQEKK